MTPNPATDFGPDSKPAPNKESELNSHQTSASAQAATAALTDEQIDGVIESLFPDNEDDHWHADWMKDIARPLARAILAAASPASPAAPEQTARGKDRPLFDPNFPREGYVSDAEWEARRTANANVYEQRLRNVLSAVQDYLPPDGIDVQAAMNRIIAQVDPWPARLIGNPPSTKPAEASDGLPEPEAPRAKLSELRGVLRPDQVYRQHCPDGTRCLHGCHGHEACHTETMRTDGMREDGHCPVLAQQQEDAGQRVSEFMGRNAGGQPATGTPKPSTGAACSPINETQTATPYGVGPSGEVKP